jgi:hypothetical protein
MAAGGARESAAAARVGGFDDEDTGFMSDGSRTSSGREALGF